MNVFEEQKEMFDQQLLTSQTSPPSPSHLQDNTRFLAQCTLPSEALHFDPQVDYRLVFLRTLVVSSLSAKARWDELISNAESRKALQEFFYGPQGDAIFLYCDAENNLFIAGASSTVTQTNNIANQSPTSSASKKLMGYARAENENTIRSMYFLKCHEAPIVKPSSFYELCKIGESFEFATLPGHSLLMLERLIKDVFLPLTDPEAVDEDKEETIAKGVNDTQSLLSRSIVLEEENDAMSELSGNLTKFASQLNRAIAQVSGSVSLPMTEIVGLHEHADLKALSEDTTILSAIETGIDEWCVVINDCIESEQKKKPLGPDPLAEIQFWRDRNAGLSSLYEQLQQPALKQRIALAEFASLGSIDAFKKQVTDLLDLYTEAKDNVKFLITLERHFKHLAQGSLSTIFDIIPSMMNSLRMVWILSKSYNKDARMFPLMERIARCICERVSRELNIRTLFRRSPKETIRVIQQGRDVLESWYHNYTTIRGDIERSGTDRRWEFNRAKLFGQSSYMVKICQHLLDIAQTVEQFSTFLGPELKAVTGDVQGIDEVTARVKALIQPLEHLTFSIFDVSGDTQWNEQIKTFRMNVEEIELKTRVFIDSSFQKLRSAEGAFDLLQNFHLMESRESIQKQMMLKFTDILIQFSKEIERVRKIFDLGQSCPPVAKHAPPVSGTIAWLRSLYYRMKRSVLRFQSMPKLLESDQGRAVCKEYVALAKAITQMEKRLLSEWTDRVNETTHKRLKEFILRFEDNLPLTLPVRLEDASVALSRDKDAATQRSTQAKYTNRSSQASSNSSINNTSKHSSNTSSDQPSTRKDVSINSQGASMNYSMRSSRMQTNSKAALMNAAQSQPPRIAPDIKFIDRKIIVNFSPDLIAFMSEAKALDRMGIPIPEVARLICLQERKYYDLCEQLSAMLAAYDALIAKLNLVEKQLLVQRIADLQRIMEPGFDPINWNSLSVPTFIESCQRGIAALESLVNSVQKNSLLISRLVSGLKRTALVDIDQLQSRTVVLSIEDLNDRVENHRSTAVEAAVVKYSSMCPLLRIIELHVAEAETGRSDVMYEYYRHWEKRVFAAVTQAVAQGMKDFQTLLLQPSASSAPLIRVTAELSPPNTVTVTPTIQDIYKLLSKLLRNIPESSKHFIRWMAGTCVECKSIQISVGTGSNSQSTGQGSSNEETILYTFYDDLSKNPVIVPLMLTVTQSIQRTIQGVDKFIDSFAFYHQRYQLWNPKKLTALERFKTRANVPTAYFERQMDKYSTLAKAIQTLPRYQDIDFIRVDCLPLIEAIKQAAESWCSKYATILKIHALNQLAAIYSEVSSFATRLADRTDGIDELKLVLAVIREIRAVNLSMELSFASVEERFAVLNRFNVEVDAADAARAGSLQSVWKALLAQADVRDVSLDEVKRCFTQTTINDVSEFSDAIKQMRSRFEANGPGQMDVNDTGMEAMKAQSAELVQFMAKKSALARSEKLFNLPPTSFADLYYVEDRMAELTQIYALYSAHQDAVHKWSAILWTELESGSLNRGIAGFSKEVKRLGDRFSHLPVFKKVALKVIAFRDSVPLLLSLKNEALRDRHWKELMRTTGVKLEVDSKSFTLGSLFSMELHRCKEDISRIVSNAVQEFKIEKDITKLSKQWTAESFALVPFNGDESRGFILADVSGILLMLEDHALSLQAMTNSPFAVPFLVDLRLWEQRCNHISETLTVWMQVQRKWMYLEGIFLASDDIRMQLPEPAKKFDRVDLSFKKIMSQTTKLPNVLHACTIEHRIDDLRALVAELDKCQKSLSDYLGRKRHAFPRFFFISDDELLSILGQRSPLCVQHHMLKLFQNVKELSFSRGESSVIGLSSGIDESFEFKAPVSTEGAVENWMNAVEAEMKSTLQQSTKEAVFFYPKQKRLDWIKSQVGMVGIVGSQIWWTWEVENAFLRVTQGYKHAMKDLGAQLSQQLNDLVESIRDVKIMHNARKKLNTLIIIDVHARDIVDRFVRDSILDAREFDWESQLRFYWERQIDDVTVRQCTGQFRFGYEYQGLDGRLVITPLTDRCYMTLTQALTFHMGGSPAGPAGTGKTETVKDLAKALGLPCLVTNCGEGLDFKAMGSIFSGLVQTGAWGCFDEFNRIDVEVLSVVSSQLQTIQSALNSNKQRFEFLGKEINIKSSVGFFITMNPGYEGRTELPDNLKALFRPVTMIVPDLLQICEIMLFSEGFTGARTLAKKMTVLYRLAAEQLSKQFHYDFGLRALKSVLVMAGSLKSNSPGLSEELILMRALYDQNLPKFVFEDVPLFTGLINDLFPTIDCPRLALPSLKSAIVDDLTSQGKHHRDEAVFQLQVDKAVQLYETLGTRHSVMLVGPTCGGKSVVLNSLARAHHSAFKKHVRLHTLNPKALSVSELYGTLDNSTRDWTDGLLSKIFRECNEPLKSDVNELRWIVFDGDVDVLWVENMNSVMDDNKLLTLPNGERIRMEEHVKMLFEVSNLQYASPATVSRCGMVYVDPKNLGFLPWYDQWVCKRTQNDPKMAELFHLLCDRYFNSCFDLVFDGLIDGKVSKSGPCQNIVPVSRMALLKQFTALFSALLPTDSERGGVQSSMFDIPVTTDGLQLADVSEQASSIATGSGPASTRLQSAVSSESTNSRQTIPNRDPDIIESIFLFCLIWSLGAPLQTESRIRFDAHIKTLSHRACVPVAGKSQLPEDSLYDYQFNLDSSTPRWQKWEPAPYNPPSPFEFTRILVPTLDTTRYTFLLSTFIQAKTPILFVGEAGTAKSVTIMKYLNSLNPAAFTFLYMNFSSRTSSLDVQLNIESNVDKRTGLVFGPANSKQMVVFYDDLNMPKVDAYGTQQPIALLKFLVDRQCMYDRGVEDNSKVERLARKTFRDLLHVGAMAPPGGGRSPIDPRFTSLFALVAVTPPNESSLTHIYQSMLSAHLQPFASEVRDMAPRLTTTMIKFYRELCNQLPPTPSKFHYVFNLRDLSRVWQGLMMSVPQRYTSIESVLRLWRNECLRVFYDRLISEADRSLVKDKLLDSFIRDTFPVARKVVCLEPSLFGDFGRDEPGVDPLAGVNRVYDDLGSHENISAYFNDQLEHYNHTHEKQMDLVLFDAALEHVTRILRIIRTPRSHALLVGLGGSGKQSLTRLAAHAARYRLFTINLTRNYSEADLREDLKGLYTSLLPRKDSHATSPNAQDMKELGKSNPFLALGASQITPVVFMFTDAHVKDDGFLEIINNILTCGTVPALFSDEEKQPFIDAMRGEIKAMGQVVNAQNCWNHFVSKCADSVHLVLCFSPAGDALRRRCRSFPGLVSNTTLDWFFPWPSSALHAVASKFITAEDNIEPEHRSKIIAHMVQVHTSVIDYSAKFVAELRRFNSVTPKNFLDYIHAYRLQLRQNREENVRQYCRLDGGLTKLIDAGDAVQKYGVELADKKIIVDAKSKECQSMIVQIKERSKRAEAKQQMAAEREAQLVEDNARINEEKAEAEKALLEAEPELAAAAEALLKLKKEDIAEVKVLQKPPVSVQLVCQCVLELRPNGNEDPTQGWNAAKAMMNDANFLLRLKTYPKDSITDKQMAKVNKILKKKTTDPKQKLTLENLQRISRASAGLLQWVLAIVNYYRVAKEVEPRRLKVKTMEKAKLQAEEDLQAIQAELTALQAEIVQLRRTYSEKSEELRDLEEKAVLMEKHLHAASQLINGLSSEKIRWTAEKEKLLVARSKLVGDCLLAASFLSYCGAFTFDYRQKMLYSDWMFGVRTQGIPLTEPFKLETLLTSEVETSKWSSEGLPSDELSVQNGLLTMKSNKFPLCIDPQQQACRWVKNQCSKGDKELKVRSSNDSDWMRQLELAIQFGNPFLLENLGEDLDPVMDPILEKQLIPNGAGFAVVLGDSTVDWSPDFRLFLTTKLANPRYSPEVAGKTQIINYSVTRTGLEDQLLNAVIGLEREDLHTQREELIQTISRNAITLVELEDNILRELNSSSGNLLDNHVLILTLKDTKSNTLSIADQLVESRQTADKIETVTNTYRPIAKRGAVLFFAMAAISVVNPMYEFSLQAYIDVFRKAVSSSPRQPTVSMRVDAIIKVLTRVVYDYTCTGIFERHKLMFSLQMCLAILDGEDKLNHEHLDFFLKGNTLISDPQVERAKPTEWLPTQGWRDLIRLQSLSSSIPQFKELLNHVDKHIMDWKDWYDLQRPEEQPMPLNLRKHQPLTTLQNLLLFRCFRPDRLLNAIKTFVVSEMHDDYFVQPPVLQYERIFSQSTHFAPVVFILSPGADPLSSLVTLAKNHGFLQARFKSLALGQGQAKAAERLLEQGYHRGHWVVLENLHLMKSWLTTLDKLLQGLTQPHKDFRLFLTTNPTNDFPLGILQNALKVVTEPPDGLKMNIKTTYARLSSTDLDECPHRDYRRLVYVLAFFHAVIQERRKYGSWGWNVNYDFSDSDFDVSRRLLSMYLNKAHNSGNASIPWASLRYLIGECMYGGRVTDSFDRRILNTYLEEYAGDFIFDNSQPFAFARLPNGYQFTLPEICEGEPLQQHVDALPSENAPQVFGLHSNAEIAYNTQFVKEMWRNLIDIQPRQATAQAGMSRDDFIGKVATDLLNSLPEAFDLVFVRRELVKRIVVAQSKLEKETRDKAVKGKKKKDDSVANGNKAIHSQAVPMPPTTIVLLQELERWNTLVTKMRESLTELLAVLRGVVGMSSELEDLSSALFDGTLPAGWRRLAPATEKPLGPWMAHFHRRYQQYSEWASEGHDPKVMWLAGLHIPESYLTALVQTTCRSKKWPLDKSTLYTCVTSFATAEDVPERPAQGCYVQGLHIEGAAWDATANKLIPQFHKSLISYLPILQVVPIETSKLKLQSTFRTPVYVTQARRSGMGVGLVFEADLDTDQHASHWILQGAAILLNHDH